MTTPPGLQVGVEDPRTEDVRTILENHHSFAADVTPAGHVHALDAGALVDPAVTLFGARRDGVLVGVCALKQLDNDHGEVKSMHTVATARGGGVGRALLQHVLDTARARRYGIVSLETGTMDAFAPARHLYESFGFAVCAPFGSYTGNPHSTCMTMELTDLRDDAEAPSGSTDVYTHGHDAAVLRSHTWRTVDNSAAYLVPQLGAGRSLLDVGCGPATLTVDLARRVAPGRVVGIDVGSILETSQATVDAAGDDVDVELREGDVYGLQFDDGSFDVVHAHQVLQHLSDPVAALREMHRVCGSNGVVAARDSDYGAFRWWPAAPALDAWLELYHDVTHANRAEPDAGRHLLSWALAAGLSEVTLTSSTWVFATPEERSWWGGLWSERVAPDSTFGRRAIELGAATAGDLAVLATGWSAWAAHDDACFFVPHVELVARKR